MAHLPIYRAVRNVLGPGIMYPIDTLMTLMMVLTLMLVKDWSLALMALLPLRLYPSRLSPGENYTREI